jgi:hypothetical protein
MSYEEATMSAPEPLLIAKGESELFLLPKMANRHGLVAGATGTGKTVTLQSMAQAFSNIGVPVFLADVKGDLSGMSQAGSAANAKIAERVQQLGLLERGFAYAAAPVVFWDIYGEQGHPLRATASEMGPLLLSRLMSLNETQTGVLTLVFKIADDKRLLLLDLKDLQAMVRYVGENAKQFTTSYGNISTASVGAIQRGLLELEQQGAERLFGEPTLALDDLLQTAGGKGVVNILAASELMQAPKLYSTFLLWLLAELFEQLPEVGDLEKPKLVFFFDEAHLLFDDAPRALTEKIEQVVRLIRSKGVGVYFVSQSPLDLPEDVLGQLGNRVQHALRAFTPRDQKAVKAAAETFRTNPSLDVQAAITELGVGEALISFLDAKGAPGMVERALITPPGSQIGPITPEQRQAIIKASTVYGHYEQQLDRESAFELLKQRADELASQEAAEQAEQEAERRAKEAEQEARRLEREAARAEKEAARAEKEAERQRKAMAETPSTLETVGKAAADFANSRAGREIVRGILGTLFGTGTSRR